MRIEQDHLGQIKNYVYIGSAAVLFLTWCLSLAALTQTGGVDGRLAWVFGLCFLTTPLIVYQSLTPLWSRTARFSNPHVHALVDGLLTIFWFSAWISLASYVASGKGHGTSTDKNATGCDNFSHGSASKCKISEADAVFSAVMMLCFVATSFFSFKVLMEYRRTGIAPNQSFMSKTHVAKGDISYPQSSRPGTGYKEDEWDFDSRLDVEDGRDSGYSFEAQRVQGGPTLGAAYAAPSVGAYASIPVAEEYGGHNERPTSFGGPLNRI